MFTFKEGRGNPQLQEGTIQVGRYGASAELTAHFSSGIVNGCLGCDGPVTIEGYSISPNGDSFVFSEPFNARLTLHNASITVNGQFEGDTFLTLGGRSVASSEGKWGGQFSSINNPSGNPRLIAGTAGADWTGTNGAGAMMARWSAR